MKNVNAFQFLGEDNVVLAVLNTDGTVALKDSSGETLETYPDWQSAVKVVSNTDPTDSELGSKTMMAQLMSAMGATSYKAVIPDNSGEKPKRGKAKIAEGTKLEKEVTGDVVRLTPDQLIIGRNPRGETNGIEEMAESMKKQADLAGDCLIQNIVVGPPTKAGKYPVIAGFRRATAAQTLQTSRPNKPVYWTLRALVVDVDKCSALAIGLRENLARKDMNALAIARSFHELEDDGWTRSQIAREYGYSNALVTNIMKVSEPACKPLHKFIEAGIVNQTQAINIAKLAESSKEDFNAAMEQVKAAAEAGKPLQTDAVTTAVRERKQAEREQANGGDGGNGEAEQSQESPEPETPSVVALTRAEIRKFISERTLPGEEPLITAILKPLGLYFEGHIKEKSLLNQWKRQFTFTTNASIPDTGLLNPTTNKRTKKAAAAAD